METHAVRPSVEAMTSCGSGPTGRRASTFRVAGSTMARVWARLERASRARGGVDCAMETEAAPRSSAAIAVNLRARLNWGIESPVWIAAAIPADRSGRRYGSVRRQRALLYRADRRRC